MKSVTCTTLCSLLFATAALGDNHAGPDPAIAHPDRSPANIERDAQRKPEKVLAFVGLSPGDVVLDWGSGGGYWAELFAAEVGAEGKVYANVRAGEGYESSKDDLAAQYAPFGNVDVLPVASGDPVPLDDDSVDTVMLSYLYHHLHYTEAAGEDLPPASAALLAEFRRVLKPGGTFIVIEHEAAAGASRARSAEWHRTPAAMARADITGAGFEFVAEAPTIYLNPDDNLRNMSRQPPFRNNTTAFVHKYAAQD